MADAYSAALIQALQGERQRYAQQNPLISGGQALNGVNLYDADKSGWENAAVAALQGFGSGALQGFGNYMVDSQYNDLNNQMFQALSAKDPSSAMAGNPQLQQFAPLIKAQQNERQQNLADLKAQQDDAFKREIQKALGDATLRDPRVQRELANQVLPQKQGTGSDTPIGAPSSGLSFPGVTPIVERQNALFQQFVEQGYTPSQASQAAREALKAERDSTGDSFDQAKAAREKADALAGIANQAEAALAGAGYTGWGGQARQTLSKVAGMVSDDQAQKASSGEVLNQLNAQLMGMARVPGSGATSDFEAKQYLASGPSLSNTPQGNAAIIEKMKNLAQINRDYADFLEAFRRDAGTTDGADALWRQYKEAYPIFTTEGGEMKINERPSWRAFFSGGGSQRLGAADVVGSGVSKPESNSAYSEQELQSAGYSAKDIQALRAQGKVR